MGPNNSGKSIALREIRVRLERPANQYETQVVVGDVGITRRVNTQQEMLDWLKEHRSVRHESGTQIVRSADVGNANAVQLAVDWQNLAGSGREFTGTLTSHLVKEMYCEARLQFQGQAPRQEPGAAPEQPVHWLVSKESYLESFRSAFSSAFGMNVVLDAWGPNIRLRVSRSRSQEDFKTSTSSGIVDSSISDKLSELPFIESQSDGVRSFSSMILGLSASPYPVVLIDEPEAFLHPPQARLIGREIAKRNSDGQVFVATHSLDVLLGILSEDNVSVQVVRLTRDNDVTSSKVLNNEQLRLLWRDPLLRYSKALDGLFHDGVVVCEGDADSYFYSSIASNRSDSPPDIMYTFAGGKQRLHLIASALVAVGVPVRVVADFDILNSLGILDRIVTALGAELSDDDRRNLRVVDSGVRGNQKQLNVAELRKDLLSLAESDEVVELSDLVRDVDMVIHPKTGWKLVKTVGVSGVPNGDSTLSVKELLARLRDMGLFVVPVGEVESFVPEASGHGPVWIANVFEGGHLNSSRDAQEFVSLLVDSFQP
ncbi:ATP-binding protein [Pseudonocardia sp. ICBG1122]|nr:ATP-binding protein [Pseudonocardia pini]